MNILYPNYPAPNNAMMPRDTSTITDLIIHHSDGSPNQSPLDIDREHRAENWAMIGYDYVVGPTGTVWKGRPDDVWPSAAQGDNPASLDVCLLGDFQPGTPNAQSSIPTAQYNALLDLCVYLHQKYPSINKTIGHRDVAAMEHNPDDSTACPGDVVYNRLPEIRDYVRVHIKT